MNVLLINHSLIVLARLISHHEQPPETPETRHSIARVYIDIYIINTKAYTAGRHQLAIRTLTSLRVYTYP